MGKFYKQKLKCLLPITSKKMLTNLFLALHLKNNLIIVTYSKLRTYFLTTINFYPMKILIYKKKICNQIHNSIHFFVVMHYFKEKTLTIYAIINY